MWSSLSGRGRGTDGTAAVIAASHCSVYQARFLPGTLRRIRDHLLRHQRPEQSGFTPGKSTIDRILALRVIVERRREFRRGLLAAYIDLKKAFDTVHRESLWEILRLRGIPTRIIELIANLFTGTESAVRCGGGLSSFFPVRSGVRQGCVLAPTLFNTCMDWILGRATVQSHCGATLGNIMVTDLDFADDVAILSVFGNPSGGSRCI